MLDRTAVLALIAVLGCSSSDSADPGSAPDSAVNDSSSDGAIDSDSAGEGSVDAEDTPDTKPPPCGTDPWTTYGHDARRTSATDGCIAAAPSTLWRYVPAPPSGKKAKRVHNAVAQSDGIFLQWSLENGAYVGTTGLDRVSAAGARVWNFDSGTDANLGHWPLIGLGSVILNDDGLYYVDLDKGTKKDGTGVDYWGEMAADATRLYPGNDAHVDGPEIFVGAYDGSAKKVWTQNVYGKCRIDAGDLADGLAVDSGMVFYAARYVTGSGVTLPFESGVFAFDASTGAPKWSKPTKPMSMISAGSGKVFLVEDTKLVARGQTDGANSWEAPLTGAGAQAPVLAAGLVIVATNAAIVAFDDKTGTQKWSTPLTGAAATAPSITFSGGCAGPVAEAYGGVTTLAAALSSGTLVVTAFDGLHLLDLATGKETFKGAVDKAVGAAKNPVVVGNRLYLVDSSGLLALESK